MPLTDDTFYCHEQIKIPPELPNILKQFTKAAIRTQPRDVLKWSAAYFEAMMKGAVPPVSKRLNIPVATQKTDTGLTMNLLINLHRQVGHMKIVHLNSFQIKWKALDIPIEVFTEITNRGAFNDDCEWLQFLALSAEFLCKNLSKTMRMLSEILTSDPEGGSAGISLNMWTELYEYLCLINAISDENKSSVLNYISHEASHQNGIVYPRNFEHRDCPKLNSLE